MQDGIYAKFNTSKGEITVKLAYDKTANCFAKQLLKSLQF